MGPGAARKTRTFTKGVAAAVPQITRTVKVEAGRFDRPGGETNRSLWLSKSVWMHPTGVNENQAIVRKAKVFRKSTKMFQLSKFRFTNEISVEGIFELKRHT